MKLPSLVGQRAHRSTVEPSSPFAFLPAGSSSCCLATKHPSDVGSLSCRVTSKPVSASLQGGFRFFRPLKPAPHGLASRFAFPRKRGRDTGFPRSVPEVRGVRCLLSTGESMDHEAATLRPTSHSHRACQPLRLVRVTIFITGSRMFTIPAAWPLPALWLAGGRSSRDSLPAHRGVLLYFGQGRSLFRPLGSPSDMGGSIKMSRTTS